MLYSYKTGKLNIMFLICSQPAVGGVALFGRKSGFTAVWIGLSNGNYRVTD